MSEYSKLTLSFIFQNHNCFCFSWYIIELVDRMVTIFVLTQRSMLSVPPRYLKHVPEGHRKFSRHSREKIIPAQSMRFYQNFLTWLWVQLIYFEQKIFSQLYLENFLWPSGTCLRYLGGLLNMNLFVSKTIVTIRYTNLIVYQEKQKQLWFWKMKLKFALEYFDKISCF